MTEATSGRKNFFWLTASEAFSPQWQRHGNRSSPEWRWELEAAIFAQQEAQTRLKMDQAKAPVLFLLTLLCQVGPLLKISQPPNTAAQLRTKHPITRAGDGGHDTSGSTYTSL